MECFIESEIPPKLQVRQINLSTLWTLIGGRFQKK
jgi:hypothetical protein